MGSWKTTAIGISSALGALAASIKALAEGDVDLAITSTLILVAAIGHIFARDNDKSSEDVGAK